MSRYRTYGRYFRHVDGDIHNEVDEVRRMPLQFSRKGDGGKSPGGELFSPHLGNYVRVAHGPGNLPLAGNVSPGERIDPPVVRGPSPGGMGTPRAPGAPLAGNVPPGERIDPPVVRGPSPGGMEPPGERESPSVLGESSPGGSIPPG